MKNRKNVSAVSAEVEFAKIDPLNEVLLTPERSGSFLLCRPGTVNVSLRDVTKSIRKPGVFFFIGRCLKIFDKLSRTHPSR